MGAIFIGGVARKLVVGRNRQLEANNSFKTSA